MARQPNSRAEAEVLAAVRGCLDRCVRTGADPVAALDRLGLLRSDKELRAAAARAVGEATADLEKTTVTQLAVLLGQVRPQTPLDTKGVIQRWLWLRVQALGKVL